MIDRPHGWVVVIDQSIDTLEWHTLFTIFVTIEDRMTERRNAQGL